MSFDEIRISQTHFIRPPKHRLSKKKQGAARRRFFFLSFGHRLALVCLEEREGKWITERRPTRPLPRTSGPTLRRSDAPAGLPRRMITFIEVGRRLRGDQRARKVDQRILFFFFARRRFSSDRPESLRPRSTCFERAGTARLFFHAFRAAGFFNFLFRCKARRVLIDGGRKVWMSFLKVLFRRREKLRFFRVGGFFFRRARGRWAVLALFPLSLLLPPRAPCSPF